MNHFLTRSNLDADAEVDGQSGKIRFLNIVGGEGPPTVPPSAPMKPWLYFDRNVSPALLYIWNPGQEAWLDAGGSGSGGTSPMIALGGYTEEANAASFLSDTGFVLSEFLPPGSNFTLLVRYASGAAAIWTRNSTAHTSPGPHWAGEDIVTIQGNWLNKVWMTAFIFMDSEGAPPSGAPWVVGTDDATTFDLRPWPVPAGAGGGGTSLADVVTAMSTDESALATATEARVLEMTEYLQVGNVDVYAIVDCQGEFDPPVDGSSFIGGPGGVERPGPGTEVQNQDFLLVLNAITPQLNGFWVLGGEDPENPGTPLPWTRPADDYLMYNGFEYGDLKEAQVALRSFDVMSGTSFGGASDGVTYSVHFTGPEFWNIQGLYKAGTIQHMWIVPEWLGDNTVITIPRYVQQVRMGNSDVDVAIRLPQGGTRVAVYSGGGSGELSVLNGNDDVVAVVLQGRWGHFRNRNNYSAWEVDVPAVTETKSDPPTATGGVGAGTGATISMHPQSSDTSGVVAIDAGPDPIAGDVVVIEFANDLNDRLVCPVISPGSLETAAAQVHVEVRTNGWAIVADAPILAGNAHTWYFSVGVNVF